MEQTLAMAMAMTATKSTGQQVKSITTTMTITTTIATTTATKLAEDAGFEFQAKPFDVSKDSQVERARLVNILRIYLYFIMSTL